MDQLFQVTGMTCGYCERAVTASIKALDPGAKVAVDLEAGRVTMETVMARSRIVEAIESEGYKLASA